MNRDKFDYSGEAVGKNANAILSAVRVQENKVEETFGKASGFAKIIMLPMLAYFFFTTKQFFGLMNVSPLVKSNWFVHNFTLDTSFFMLSLCFFQVILGLGAGVGILYMLDRLIASEKINKGE